MDLAQLESRLTPKMIALAQAVARGESNIAAASREAGYATPGAARRALQTIDMARYLRALALSQIEQEIPYVLKDMLKMFRDTKTPAAVRARIGADLLNRAGVQAAEIREEIETERAPSLSGMGLPELSRLLARLEAKGAGRIVDVAPAPESGGEEGGEPDVFA